MIDPDDYAKEDCGCGHRRSGHSMTDERCTREVLKTDYASLPDPVYDDAEDADPFGRPINWPPPAEMPKTWLPCGCTRFHQPEPEPPEPW